eukprot:3582549-Prymnesium_polylepis.2
MSRAGSAAGGLARSQQNRSANRPCRVRVESRARRHARSVASVGIGMPSRERRIVDKWECGVLRSAASMEPTLSWADKPLNVGRLAAEAAMAWALSLTIGERSALWSVTAKRGISNRNEEATYSGGSAFGESAPLL